jgi:hypothetical protein
MVTQLAVVVAVVDAGKEMLTGIENQTAFPLRQFYSNTRSP